MNCSYFWVKSESIRYQGEIMPNVSGWIKEKIKENVNER